MSAATYITTERYASIADMPICLPQTELRRGSSVTIATFKLEEGQRASIRFMDMNVLRILTPGVTPDRINSTYGICYVGVFAGYMAASPSVTVSTDRVGTASLNAGCESVIASPGVYTVKLINNTGKTAAAGLDLSICVTGVVKIYE